jgi:hypothetical protein
MAYESYAKFFSDLEEAYNNPRATVSEQFLILRIITSFMDNVCVGKLKTQRGECRRLIEKLNPAYAIGYFGKSKK